mmetsp:Transcript_48356/g.59493  ORF Transcript_48356/g.59493 Transcript_48356/m.59493 type:complete len:114 (+) Transcript_48356:51-392(+)
MTGVDPSFNSTPEEKVGPERDKGRWMACLSCKLIKASEQWDDGCENCPNISGTRGTTPNFTGVVALMTSHKSWVAKHQRISRFVSGLYAINVKGNLPDEMDDDNDHDGYNDDN